MSMNFFKQIENVIADEQYKSSNVALTPEAVCFINKLEQTFGITCTHPEENLLRTKNIWDSVVDSDTNLSFHYFIPDIGKTLILRFIHEKNIELAIHHKLKSGGLINVPDCILKKYYCPPEDSFIFKLKNNKNYEKLYYFWDDYISKMIDVVLNSDELGEVLSDEGWFTHLKNLEINGEKFYVIQEKQFLNYTSTYKQSFFDNAFDWSTI